MLFHSELCIKINAQKGSGDRKKELSCPLWWVSTIRASVGPVAPLKTSCYPQGIPWLGQKQTEPMESLHLPIHFRAAGELVIVERLMKDIACAQLLSWGYISSESAPVSTDPHRARDFSPALGLTLSTDI